MKKESTLLILAILGCSGTLGALFWGIGVNNKLQTALGDIDTAKTKLAAERTKHAADLQAVQEQAARTLQEAQGQWSAEKEDLEARQTERMAEANRQFGELMENGDRSLAYIGTLESKLRAGQKLEGAELEKLGAIALGLDQLRQRYKQPMQEFTELGAYFDQRANQKIEAPDTARFKRVRRLFSKDYREQEVAYQQQLGEKAAYEQASARFAKAYKATQSRIDEAARDMAAHSQRIYALIGEKEQNKEDLEAFFRESRSAIRSHLDIIELDPDIDIAPTPERRD